MSKCKCGEHRVSHLGGVDHHDASCPTRLAVEPMWAVDIDEFGCNICPKCDRCTCLDITAERYSELIKTFSKSGMADEDAPWEYDAETAMPRWRSFEHRAKWEVSGEASAQHKRRIEI